MAYRGRYYPTHPKKYKGNPSNIIYRSLWERKFMVYCDKNDRILEWGSEEFFIPYRSPIDGKIHRYFPDFYVKVKTKQGTTKKWVVEVKPKIQTRPPRTPKRKTKKYINEVRNWAINDAKWKNAIEYCKDRNMEFIIITEDELGI
jgi:hypothetical protein|tara:strand:- start:4 stop:438 length:435 start_codon:yes stop_codon:yes gene_type:complete